MGGPGEDGYYNEEGTLYTHVWSRKAFGVQKTDVWAQVLTADHGTGSKIYARDIELASIENMVITPCSPISTPCTHTSDGRPLANVGIFVTKEIYPHKDKLDNWASVWIWSATDTPYTNSVWLEIDAIGP